MAVRDQTYCYDGRICRDVMQGKPLPTDRWSIEVPVMVMIGEHGEPFITEGGQRPRGDPARGVTVGTLPGQDHSAFWMALEPIAKSVRQFFTR